MFKEFSPRRGIVLVVGLGNPGNEYKSTRHNAGLMVLDELLNLSDIHSTGTWPKGELVLASAGGQEFLALKPFVFMNNSGEAVLPVVKRYGLEAGCVLVVHDDIDIPLGDIRVKKGGGSGGHRGVSSVDNALGDNGFSRLRIGIGRPSEGIDVTDHVLSSFDADESENVKEAVNQAARTALEMLTERPL
ncbi:MAG: aminoacyl-tRNA hydrolase [Actinobacteria bacterium]|nr:aminoacyl-tRNA hydrolase [Actinomycetota bacterium]